VKILWPISGQHQVARQIFILRIDFYKLVGLGCRQDGLSRDKSTSESNIYVICPQDLSTLDAVTYERDWIVGEIALSLIVRVAGTTITSLSRSIISLRVRINTGRRLSGGLNVYHVTSPPFNPIPPNRRLPRQSVLHQSRTRHAGEAQLHK
jgi:hypothetical protein